MTRAELDIETRHLQDRANAEGRQPGQAGFVLVDTDARLADETPAQHIERRRAKVEEMARRTRELQDIENERRRRVNATAEADRWEQDFYGRRWRRHEAEIDPKGHVPSVRFADEEGRARLAKQVAAKEVAASERRQALAAKRAQVLAAIDGKDR